ncbi:MAG: ABC transporter substrate-binding protein [Thermodesulfobacteriota bacterium]|nr:ABC transporter substrate-binding protein [Thermodesulfobacteriota bacterium]
MEDAEPIGHNETAGENFKIRVVEPKLSFTFSTKALVVVILAGLFFSGTTVAATITDNAGRTIAFDKPFTRVISLYGAHTENLFFLGLDKEIIGVSKNESYPEKAKKKPWFSYHDDAEKFLGVMPDLVLVRPMIERGYPGLIKRLEKSGITVVSLQPGTVSKMYKYWRTLGILTGKRDEACEMINSFQKKRAYFFSLGKDVKNKKKVYFEAIHSRMKTFTPGSMALFALEAAGGVNVADDAKASRGTNIGNYGKEKILSHASEIDVFIAQKGVMNQTSKEIIKNEPGFSIIKAVKNDQIYIIDETIVSRPGFRLLKGIKRIREILYPGGRGVENRKHAHKKDKKNNEQIR